MKIGEIYWDGLHQNYCVISAIGGSGYLQDCITMGRSPVNGERYQILFTKQKIHSKDLLKKVDIKILNVLYGVKNES